MWKLSSRTFKSSSLSFAAQPGNWQISRCFLTLSLLKFETCWHIVHPGEAVPANHTVFCHWLICSLSRALSLLSGIHEGWEENKRLQSFSTPHPSCLFFSTIEAVVSMLCHTWETVTSNRGSQAESFRPVGLDHLGQSDPFTRIV